MTFFLKMRSGGQSFLSWVIAKVALLSFILFLMLWSFDWVGSRLNSGMAQDSANARQNDRYYSARQLSAIKSFEHAILAQPANLQTPEVAEDKDHAARVLAAVPQCASEWSKGPSRLRIELERWRGRTPQHCSSLAADEGGRRLHFDTCSDAERMAMKLNLLDDVVSRLNRQQNRPFKEPLVFDSDIWLRVVAEQVGKPVQPDNSEGRQPRLQCQDVVHSLDAMSRNDGELLRKHAVWRDATPVRATRSWRQNQMVYFPTSLLARRNPWRGIPGCIYLNGGSGRDETRNYLTDSSLTNREVCENQLVSGSNSSGRSAPLPMDGKAPASGDDPRWRIPPSLATLLAPLESLRQPSGELYAVYTEEPEGGVPAPTSYRYGPNQLDINGARQAVGFSVSIGIDPVAQSVSQQVAACYTGNQAICRALGIRRPEDGTSQVGSKLLENALARMAAIAIIDVQTGRIEAIAGELSPCTRQMYDGPGLGPECDGRVPGVPKYVPDLLLNPAVFHDAIPASTVKPIMAAGFLSDNRYGSALERAESSAMSRGVLGPLQTELKKSASERFLDRMFCVESGFRDCDRPNVILQSARLLGWNSGCEPGSGLCGMQDLLFGRPMSARAQDDTVAPISLPYMYGRILTRPAGDNGSRQAFGSFKMPPGKLPPEAARACSAGRWNSNCRGADLVDLVAEGWGQGHARSTTVGVAGVIAHVAASSSGATSVRRPHLVTEVRGIRGPLMTATERWNLASPMEIGIPREHARIILGGMLHSHRQGGTANLACLQVLDAATCNRADWIAGKTGTPSFRNDKRSLAEIAKICSSGNPGRDRHPACANLRPYKWYTAAYKSSPQVKNWDKAVAVLVERNWYESGRIYAPGTGGSNIAAEVGLQIVKRIRDSHRIE